MSLYNMVFGMNASLAVVLSPFLPRPADQFPRFRDVFLADEERPEWDEFIHVYTRMGGGNRECWQDRKIDNCDCSACDTAALEADPNCLDRYDDGFDCTYCTFIFEVPEELKVDFDHVLAGEFTKTSQLYRDKLYSQFREREKVMEFLEKLFVEEVPE